MVRFHQVFHNRHFTLTSLKLLNSEIPLLKKNSIKIAIMSESVCSTAGTFDHSETLSFGQIINNLQDFWKL